MVTWREQLHATRKIPSYRATLQQGIENLWTVIRSLRIHPIKSLGLPLYLNTATLTRFGLATEKGEFCDRQLLLGRRQQKASKPHVTHRLFSQRQFGPLCRCTNKFEHGKLVIEDLQRNLTALKLEPNDLEPRRGQTTIVEMHGNEYECCVEGNGGPVTGWVRRFLKNCECKYADEIDVLYQPQDFRRTVADHHRRDQEGGIRYADGGQLLLGNYGTLAWMNAGLQRAGKRTTEMDAFRPNIEISLPPNAEDLIDTLTIEAEGRDVPLLAGLLSVRCTMIDINFVDGGTPDTAINDWLRENRPYRPTDPPPEPGKMNRNTTFGLNMVIPGDCDGAIIKIGDRCTVTKEKQ